MTYQINTIGKQAIVEFCDAYIDRHANYGAYCDAAEIAANEAFPAAEATIEINANHANDCRAHVLVLAPEYFDRD